MVLAIIVVITIFGTIMWTLSFQTVPTYSAAPQYTAAGFGGRCSNSPEESGENRPDEYPLQKCDIGLVCVNSFCYKNLGTTCNSLLECIPGTLICNGHCSNNNKNGLNDACFQTSDCDTGFNCDNNICKRDTGSSCTKTTNCATNNYCNNSICKLLSNPGQLCQIVPNENSCTVDHVCSSSGSGNINFCQPNIDTGTTGAYCYLWNQPGAPEVTNGSYKFITLNAGFVTVPSCSSDLVCNIVRDFNGLPFNSAIEGYGFCSFRGEWNGSCNNSIGCQNPQVCINGKCSFPVEDNKLNFPLSCDFLHSTGICLNNYTCSADNHECLGKENNTIPVTNATQCGFGNVSSRRGIVYQYFQKDLSVTFDRLITASWDNTGISFPTEYDDIASSNIYFSSFEQKNNSILVILHTFTSKDFFICSTAGKTKYTVSSNIVGNFTASPIYNGTTINGDLNATAIAVANYSGYPDYVGFTTTGNYYTVIRYTLLNVIYPTTQFPNAKQPVLTDFSRVYYDTSPDFKNSNLTINSTTGQFVYTNYTSNFGTDNVKYVYSISVDDRVINPSFPNSVRIFMSMNSVSSSGLPPINSINETNPDDISSSLVQRTGALISIDFDSSINYYIKSFHILSYSQSIGDNGVILYDITWCHAYINRTMDTLKASEQCYAKSNTIFNSVVLLYFPSVSGYNNTFSFPYDTGEGSGIYPYKISLYSSKSFDLTYSSIAYIAKKGSDTYLGLSYLAHDFILPATVNFDTMLSIPYPDTSLDTLDYKPRLLLISKVCGI